MTSEPVPEHLKFAQEIEEHSESIVGFLPATKQRLAQKAQDSDAVCQQIKSYCQEE